jgi:hypothetical protein
MAQNRLRWIVRRVWVTDDHGTKRRGTLWSVHGDSVKIRVDHVPGVAVLPVAARGKGFRRESRRGARPVAPALPPVVVYRPYYGRRYCW